MMKQLLSLILLIIGFQSAIAQISPHGTIRFSCNNCHTTESWKMRSDAAFIHSSTGFDLTGMHTMIECRACHQGLKFSGASSACQSCHTDVHRGELGVDCLRCHTSQSWKISDMIQRHQQTRFPLLGQHVFAPCQACHARNANQQYTGTPTTCIGCHRNDFLNTQNPNHTIAGFSTECAQCHMVNAATWGGSFNHQLTAFPLTGAHRAVACSRCHTNNVFKSVSHECYACHSSEYTAVASPNHALGSFSHQCMTCHTTTVWKPSQFNHDNTGFALVGAHRTAVCEQCHTGGQYAGLHKNCIDCHRTEYIGVKNPNHVTASFSSSCLSCHSMNAWKPATFDHTTTKFALTGKHLTVQCQDCHVNGSYQLVYTDCYACHQTDYQKPASPNHVSAQFAHTCDQCHTTSTWSPSTFDHNKTAFALVGAHLAVPCTNCHVNNVYAGLHQNCIDCHQVDYANAANPNHTTLAFPTTCTQCHSMNGWKPASFDHSTTRFALTGKHTTTPCVDCHVNSNYQLTYANCFQCHSTDYNGTTNPSHTTAKFPTTCETCHSTTSWSGATFNHTWFPVSHGNANGVCSTCHTDPSNYSVFQCTICHTKTQTDSKHSEVANYTWNSANCYSCHPSGHE